MNTTIELDDDLVRQAKEFAAQRGLTFTALLDQALREFLARQDGPTGAKEIKLPTFRGNGLQPGVDLDDSAALLDLTDNTEIKRRAGSAASALDRLRNEVGPTGIPVRDLIVDGRRE